MKFFEWLVKNVIAYFILWCIVAFVVWIICLMFGKVWSADVVWTIVGIIFLVDLLVTAGKNVDDM
jgi:hypothetical protein